MHSAGHIGGIWEPRCLGLRQEGWAVGHQQSECYQAGPSGTAQDGAGGQT